MIIVDCSSTKDEYLGNLNWPAGSPKDAKASSAGAQIKELLTARYKMTDLGETRRFLGIEVMRDDNGITLAQNCYIATIALKILLRSTPSSAAPPRTLLPPKPLKTRNLRPLLSVRLRQTAARARCRLPATPACPPPPW